MLGQENLTGKIDHIVYDTRKIVQGKGTLFVCLKTESRDGHDFISEAIQKGVRCFLVDREHPSLTKKGIQSIRVNNTLDALQKLAYYHRSRFDIPIIVITGSAGKTITKEWLYTYLSKKYKVARSPKSFNSQLGVAMSLFEINSETEIALIEAGISLPGEMYLLEEMISPTHGILVSFGKNHRNNFENIEEHWINKISVFENVKKTWLNNKLKDLSPKYPNFIYMDTGHFSDLDLKNFEEENLTLIEAVADEFGITEDQKSTARKHLPKIALRLETVEGKDQQNLILDAYNWTIDGLEQALGYQQSLQPNGAKILVFDFAELKSINPFELNFLLNRFSMTNKSKSESGLMFFSNQYLVNPLETKGACILFKGSSPLIKKTALSRKAKKHTTYVEVNLQHLRHNLKTWQKTLPKETGILAMVKASSYGVELGQVGQFLSNESIQYMGVAYIDEGIELRQNKVQTPIMVMNCDQNSWEECIKNNLEPSIYCFEQLESLLKTLIHLDIQGFPIHIKVDTGMRRLGFMTEEVEDLLNVLAAQPEVRVGSIFSHLADADNSDKNFTQEQIKIFMHWVIAFKNRLPYSFLTHILNTDGTSYFQKEKFDLVRLGIGLYGITSNSKVEAQLKPVLAWYSEVSQIKTIQKGDTVGYGRTYIADREENIAIVPVGYADGLRRTLSNGIGSLYIDGIRCPIIGNVCMDMVMISLGELNPKVGDVVEIVGPNQSIRKLATDCQTIPYEIMTSLSRRMPRKFIYSED